MSGIVQADLSGSPWILLKFLVISTDPPSCSPKNQVISPKILRPPPQGINNYRSLTLFKTNSMYICYIGMCRPKGYDICGINRVSFLIVLAKLQWVPNTQLNEKYMVMMVYMKLGSV